ncbi:MAG TPA: hypothetical protein VFR81_11935 [Longimicrobium sp.]|nr:hypothetical protein [Longimicrobium sp.]
MGGRLMQMALAGATGMVGRRMAMRGGRGMRVAGMGMTNAAWLVPLGLAVARRMRRR